MAANTKHSRASTAILLIFFGLCWSSFTLFVDALIIRDAFWQIVALGYSTTSGGVTASEVALSDDHDTSAPKITYTYTVAGNKHVGNRYRYGQGSSGDDNARRVVAEHPVGRQVTVYYSPNDASESVLLAGIEGHDLFLAMFMTPFNAIMLGIWGGLFLEVRNRRQSHVAGGVQFWDDGYQTRVQLTPVKPVAVGVAASCGTGSWAFL
jgi:hypothetical protein